MFLRKVEGQEVNNIIPNSLIVLTTNQCTATCDHCCMNSSSKRTERVDIDLVLRSIEQFKRTYNIGVVVFAGGEPTLLKGNLLRAIAKCRKLNIISRLVTNASWAINEAKALAGFDALFRAGLSEVNISCDDYHSPFIPFERIKIAYRAARKFPFRAIIIANASHKGSKLTPEYIRAEIGEELPFRFDEHGHDVSPRGVRDDQGTIVGISNASLQRLGRAETFFKEADVKTYPSEMVLNQPCPNAIRLPAITPEGTLAACCGFELAGNPVLDFGSLKTNSAEELIGTANENIVARAISCLGPGFLLKFANKLRPGVVPTKDYVGICEACQDVVTNDEVLDVLFENRDRLAALLYTLEKSQPTQGSADR